MSELSLSPAELSAGIAMTAAIGATAMRYFKNSFLDERFGNSIFPTASIEAFSATIDVFEANGVGLNRDLSDDEVIRALMKDKTIINVSSPHILDSLGEAGGTKVFKTKHPVDAAEEARGILDNYGITDGRIESPMRNDATRGKMAFLLSRDAFPNGALGFRVRGKQMGPMPKKWNRTKKHGFGQAV